MSHYFEFTGTSLEEAIETAIRELQVDRKEFRYKIIADPNHNEEEVLIRVYLGGNSDKPKRDFVPHKDKKNFYKNRDFNGENDSSYENFYSMDKVEEQEVQIQKILFFLKEICNSLGIELEGFFVEDKEDEVYINLKCSEPAVLIGKQGAVLNSIQFLVGAYIPKVLKEMGELDFPKKSFTLDIQGYRSKRLSMLKEEVFQVVQKVKRSKESFLLEGEFSPIERRQIHIYAQSLSGITTESQGTGFFKTILIKPAE